MTPISLRLVCFAAALCVAGPAAAQSLKSTRAQEAEQVQLDREIAYTNSMCGSRMSARIDGRSTANWPESESLVEACDRALGAVEAACRRNGGERLASLTTFVCAGDGSGPSISGGALRYGASPGRDGFSDMSSFLSGML